MRIKLLLPVLAICALVAQVNAQTPVSCGTQITPSQQAFLDQHDVAFQTFMDGNTQIRMSGETMLFPIKHHIVRKTDGTGAVADADVTNQITILNNYYINANIQFYQCGPINYIDSDDWYDFDSSTDEGPLTSANNEVNVINVYYCGSVASSGTPVCGYAYFPGGPDVVMMANSCTPNGVTMLHELGHYFALYHTHGTSNFGTTDELVDGSNCTTAGDRLCDTPADPNLTGKVDFNCNYTGTDQDANGDYYTPNTANIMAYSLDQCSNFFSPDQYSKIEFTGLNDRQYLTCATGPCGLSTLDATNETFWGAADGSIDLEILGTPPYTYAWDNGDSTQDISGLSPGTYVVTITDGDGCVQLDSAVIGYDGCSPTDVVAFVEVAPNGSSTNIAWEIVNTTTLDVIYSRSEFGPQPLYIDTLCLPDGQTFEFIAYSKDGEGWGAGTYKVTCGGRFTIIDNGGVPPTNGVSDGGYALEVSETFTPAPCTPNDIAADFVEFPFTRCDLGSAEQVVVRVKNYSGLPIADFDVSVSADGGTPITESVSGITIGFLEEYVHTMTGTIDVSGVGFHNLNLSVTTTGDGNPTNSDTNIVIESEPTAVSSFPYIIDFESAHNLIQLQAEDDFDWTVDNGSTPTTLTGPTEDHTSGGPNGKYMFIESSLPNHPQKRAVIQTACVDISALNSPYLEFYYHMFGSGVGSLEVQVLGSQGWQTIWTKNGNRGNQWIEQDLTLHAFLGEVVKIRFIGYTSFDQYGDIAIDDIKVFNNVVPLGGSVITTTEPSCAGGDDGTATAQGTDGVPPYSYAWSNGASGQTVSNLTQGTVTVTISDALGQTFNTSASITQPTPVVSTILTSYDVTCNQGNDGNATANGFGGTPPYSYEWSDGQNTASAAGLSAGDYWVKVTDSKGCPDTAFVTLVQPDTLKAATIGEGHVDCFGGSNGYLIVDAEGGIPPYTYNWASGASGDSIGGLSAGVYTVQVIDDNGCSFTMLDTVFEPTMVTVVTDSVEMVSCFGDSLAYASVYGAGGTPPYTYLWDNGDATAFVDSLKVGSYSVTVTDSEGCSNVKTISITQPSALSSSTSSTATSCNGCSDGSASVNITGGTAPYIYAWSNFDDSTTTTNLVAGLYYVQVTDANGCTLIDSALVTEPAPMIVTVNATDPLCQNDSSGTVVISVQNGLPPFTFMWLNGLNGSTQNNLPQGTYDVLVSDASGASEMITIVLTDPSSMSVGVSSTIDLFHTPACDGTASVTSTVGGMAPYTYLWMPGGQTTITAVDLCAGLYTVTVTDANGCESERFINVGQNVGVEELADFGASLYPNPTADLFTIKFNSALTSEINLIIVNSLGEQVYVSKVLAGADMIELDGSSFAKGIYQVWISSDDRVQVMPVMIK